MPEELRGELLSQVEAGAFERAADCRYLLVLIPPDPANRKADSLLTRAQVELANKLIGQCLPDDGELVNLWMDFFQRLPPSVLVRLPVSSSEVEASIKQALGGCGLPVAVLWDERSAAPGSVCYADGRLYLHGENGELALVEATPAGYREQGRFTPANSPDRGRSKAWAYPVIAHGRLYVQDWGTLWCYDIQAGAGQ